MFMCLYGESFTKSSGMVYKLLDRRGLDIVLIDDITGIAIFCASLVSGVITSCVAYAIGWLFYGEDEDDDISINLPTELSVFGGIIGLLMCLAILRNVRSTIITLWVCFAENPRQLEINRPRIFNKLMDSHSKIGSLNMQIISDNDDDEEEKEVDGKQTDTVTR